MLSDVVLVILGLYAASTPIWFMKAVQFGAKCAEKPEEVAVEPVFNLPKAEKKPEMTDEMRADLTMLHNINVFDGTSNGQKEII